MNKPELVSAIAEKSELNKKDVELFIKTFEEVVTETLAGGDKIQLVGFGTFEPVKRAARMGRNPATGEDLQIEESMGIRFKVGKNLKDAVNEAI